MKHLNKITNIMFVFALFAAAIYLIRYQNRIELRQIENVPFFFSWIVLILAFIFRSLIWHRTLSRFGISVHWKISLASNSKPLLMKFIPGKIWGVGTTAFLVAKYGYSLTNCLIIASIRQAVQLISGLFIGACGVLIFHFRPLIVLSWFILIFYFLILIISCRSFTLPEIPIKIRHIIPKRLYTFSGMRVPFLADILLLSSISWLLIGIAFTAMFLSLKAPVGFMPVTFQPLANTIGILSFFAPSGIGVREGFMVFYMGIIDISKIDALSYAIFARFWFLAAEILVSIIGSVLDASNSLAFKCKIQ